MRWIHFDIVIGSISSYVCIENYTLVIFIQDNASTLASRVKKTDAREIESFYKRYFENYVLALKKGAQLGKVYVTAGMLFKVLCAVNKTGKVKEVAPEMVVDLGTGLPWMMCKQDDAPSPIKLNRKLVHITVGLTFMLYWPMFCFGRQGAMLAAIMPAANIIKMLLIGLGISKDDVTVKSMSRFEDHRYGHACMDGETGVSTPDIQV
ncbi:hypothetical protein ACS0TY_013419 [Phlomoides rotata]